VRAVVDPGVLVSAARSPGGPPAQLGKAVRAGRVVLVVSPRLRTELETVLRRKQIVARLDPAALDRVRRVVAQAPVVEDPPAAAVSRDPTDDDLLALAQIVAADCVISGDRDLTSLVGVEPSVLSPAAALARLVER